MTETMAGSPSSQPAAAAAAAVVGSGEGSRGAVGKGLEVRSFFDTARSSELGGRLELLGTDYVNHAFKPAPDSVTAPQ